LSTGVQTKVGTFIWHENQSTDVEKAKSFYTELLGWQTEAWSGEMEYTIIKVGDRGHGGFIAAQGGAPSHWNGSVFVEDADETVRRAEAAGGRILFGPESMPEVGRFAVIADPQGAVTTAFAPQGDGELGEGVFVWDELHTSDPAAAKSFYGEVYGWTPDDQDMGGVTYTIFKRGDVQVAGCFPLMEGEVVSRSWRESLGRTGSCTSARTTSTRPPRGRRSSAAPSSSSQRTSRTTSAVSRSSRIRPAPCSASSSRAAAAASSSSSPGRSAEGRTGLAAYAQMLISLSVA
jgi:predicted enzyme related to lactoylglutathione lyase